MMNTDDLIVELGIERLTLAQQQSVIDELNMRVGEAVLGGLSTDQVKEYEAIINGHQDVITAWLKANDPEYTETTAYQQLAQGFEDDLDKVPADKVYASMAWIEKNNPNLNQTIAGIKADLKASLAQYRA